MRIMQQERLDKTEGHQSVTEQNASALLSVTNYSPYSKHRMQVRNVTECT